MAVFRAEGRKGRKGRIDSVQRRHEGGKSAAGRDEWSPGENGKWPAVGIETAYSELIRMTTNLTSRIIMRHAELLSWLVK